MKTKHVLKSIVTVSACAIALVIAVGCSSGSSSNANSASASSASSTASSANASSAAASNTTTSTSSTGSVASSTASSAATQSASASSAASGMTEQEALAQGYQVFKGTMRVLSAEELIDVQGQDQRVAAGQEGAYAVVVFDSPTDVAGMQADGSGQTTKSAKMIGVATANKYTNFGDIDACKAYDGQQTVVAVKADSVGFPSDVRLPVGEPTAKESIILQ